jgi:hypothetical protein
MIQRNGVIAAGNSLERQDDPALRARVEALAQDGSAEATVGQTAREALGKVAGRRV